MPFKKDLALKEIKVKKGQILQRKEDLYSKVYHVQTGLLRSYTIDEKGREHIYMFAPENWIIGDSVSPQTPCDLFIDCSYITLVYPYSSCCSRKCFFALF